MPRRAARPLLGCAGQRSDSEAQAAGRRVVTTQGHTMKDGRTCTRRSPGQTPLPTRGLGWTACRAPAGVGRSSNTGGPALAHAAAARAGPGRRWVSLSPPSDARRPSGRGGFRVDRPHHDRLPELVWWCWPREPVSDFGCLTRRPIAVLMLSTCRRPSPQALERGRRHAPLAELSPDGQGTFEVATGRCELAECLSATSLPAERDADPHGGPEPLEADDRL